MSVVTETTNRETQSTRSASSKQRGPSSTKANPRKNLGSLNLQQQLELFAKWTSDRIWVPPKDSSVELAKSMLNQFGPFASKQKCWQGVEKEHRSEFTQVRQIELPRASIRLPKGRLYVTVTEQKDFDTIEEKIPDCVQTRLDEFLAGPGKKPGVRVYYLKPLCVERDHKLIFTTKQQMDDAIAKIQGEVFANYRRLYLRDRLRRGFVALSDAALAIPRALVNTSLNRKRREIEDYHRKLEFERRRRTMEAVQTWKDFRSTGCTFDEVLALTDPPTRESVIDHYVEENSKSAVDRKMFLIASAVSLPWFAAMSLGIYQLATVTLTTGLSVGVCDPVFVAEMPGKRGQLLKIGHFDEVDGVMHVEI